MVDLVYSLAYFDADRQLEICPIRCCGIIVGVAKLELMDEISGILFKYCHPWMSMVFPVYWFALIA